MTACKGAACPKAWSTCCICPTHPCQHYLGWTNNLYQCMADHRAGLGARLTQVAVERGIPFTVVRTWPGDRAFERVLKALKNGRRLCPICMGTAPWLDACTVPDGNTPF